MISLLVIRPIMEAARLFQQPRKGNICTSDVMTPPGRRQKRNLSLGSGGPLPFLPESTSGRDQGKAVL